MCMLRKAVLLAQAAIERLVLGMRVDVDKSGQDQPVAAVDDPVRRTLVILAEKGDAVVGKGNVDIATVDVP
jgi:hypothetical protein